MHEEVKPGICAQGASEESGLAGANGTFWTVMGERPDQIKEGTESRQRLNFKKDVSWPRGSITWSAEEAGFQMGPALYAGDLGTRKGDAHESKYYLESCCWERQGGLHETRNRMET